MATTRGRIEAISISHRKGMPKVNVPEAEFKADFGIVGDVHAGAGPRQISLLAAESIDRLREQGTPVSPGDFAENITTRDVELGALKVGDRLRIGDAVELEVTQQGKQCHGRCAIFARLGDCIMPREGMFARVVRAGRIRVGDVMEVLDDSSLHTDRQ